MIVAIPKDGELGSGFKAASATEKASMRSGVGSGDDGEYEGRVRAGRKRVCAIFG